MKDLRKDKLADQLDVTEQQVEDALSRLFMTVKGEAVPDAWHAQETRESPVVDLLPATPNLATGSLPNAAGVNHVAEPFSILRDDRQLAASVVPDRQRKRSRTKRRWLSTAAAIAAAAMLFTSWGQGVMASMLHTFRVQHFQTIAFSQSDLDALSHSLEDGMLGTRELDLRKFGEIKQNGNGTMRVIGAVEGERLAGRPLIHWPGDDPGTIQYVPQQELIFNLHPKEINKLIGMLGGKTELPADIDNEPFKLLMPNSFTVIPGNGTGKPLTKRLVQLPSPVLDVPGNVDVEHIRRAVLDLPLLPSEFRSKLAAIGDWHHTLPIPSVDGVDSRTLSIAGHDAIVSTTANGRMLIWLQNDWMYMLSGSLEDYPSEDDVIKEAKGLMKA